MICAVCSTAQSPDKKELATAMLSAIKRDLNPLFKIHDLVLVETLRKRPL